jgi:hypothetical protein
MTARAMFVIAIGAIACRPQTRPLEPAVGSEADDGHGELARASAALRMGGDSGPAFTDSTGQWYGSLAGAEYGGGAYGGPSYASPVPSAPPLRFRHHFHVPHRYAASVLTGALEGTVSWTAPPPRGPCVGPRAALVFIETYANGRSPPVFGRSNPGTVAKHGCALLPVAQIVTSSPAAVAIHGDAAHAQISVTAPNASQAAFELQEAGLVEVDLQPGVTRVDGDGLAPAWVVAVDTPYYTVTDDGGRFRIDDLEPGTYDVTFWSAPATAAGAPIVVHRTVRVDGKTAAQVHVSLGR